MLKSLGVTVGIAENGRQAMEMATAKPYDPILMDIRMPEMDGFIGKPVSKQNLIDELARWFLKN